MRATKFPFSAFFILSLIAILGGCTSQPACGDSACNGAENAQTCPQDCTAGKIVPQEEKAAEPQAPTAEEGKTIAKPAPAKPLPTKAESETVIIPDNETCTDTDRGINFYVSGNVAEPDAKTASGFRAIAFDKCLGNSVVEWYCTLSGATSKIKKCEYNCQGNACNLEPAK